MKILHVATYDAYGGAARAASRICRLLPSDAIQSELLALCQTGKDPWVRTPRNLHPMERLRLIHQLLHSYRLQKGAGNPILQSFGDASAKVVEEINADPADLVHLHWICNFLSIEDIARIAKPIVWTLHDMWPFCGSEHYLLENISPVYGNDPASEIDPRSYHVWKKKQECWSDIRFHIVAPSRWLAGCSQQSVLFKDCPTTVIPHPIDTAQWQPADMHEAEERWQLHTQRKRILFICSNNLSDPVKGWDLLERALHRLKKNATMDFELLLAGQEVVNGRELPFPVRWMGSIQDDIQMKWLYAAAHLLVVPSRMEAFSLVSQEAQASGLPVVGFDTGGIPDIVEHRQTGWVAPSYDVEDLSTGMEWILSDEGRRQALSAQARQNAAKKFDPLHISRQYENIYRKALSSC